MTGRIWRRLFVGVLASATVVTGVGQGGIDEAQAAEAILACPVATDTFIPAAPGPSGVAYRADGPTGPTLIVVDSDRNHLDPFDETNLWEYDLDTGTTVYSGTLPFPELEEPTGVEYDPINNVLFVSTDGSGGQVWVIEPGADLRFGTNDDPTPVTLSVPGDTEDPALDTVGGHLYVLDGHVAQVADIDPVNGDFRDGVVVTSAAFGIPVDPSDDPLDPDRPVDWEGLTYDPISGNLLASAKDEDAVIYEFTTAGVFVAQHDTSSIPGLATQSGMAYQPADGVVDVPSYWIADRGHNTDEPTVNDGFLYRITLEAPAPVSTQPTLSPITTPRAAQEFTQVGFDANAFDADCDLPLTFSIFQQPPGAGATINSSTGVFTWIPGESFGGSSPTFTIRVTDSETEFHQQVVQFNVAETNSAPTVINPGSLTRNEGETVSIGMLGSDSDVPVNSLTWLATGLPPGLSINPSSGQITGTVAASSAGVYTVTTTLRDNGSPIKQGNAVFSITIEPTTGPGPGPDPDPTPDPNDPFTDDDGHVFENSIEWLAAKGITQGCNPPTNDRFCPNSNVTRGQMATFLVRALSLPTYNGPDRFVDDNGHIFEGAIERLAQASITVGCNPPTNTRFCPDDNVTRGQMAAFLVRAFDLPAYSGPDRFVDDNANVFEGAIERLAQAGITVGCNPPTNDRFCPGDNVTRGQMAAFLKRAMGG